MYLQILSVLSLATWAIAAPQYQVDDYHHEVKTSPVPILQQKHEFHKDGYQHSFKAGNGIQAEESGYIKKTGEKPDDNLVVMHGSVSYTGPDGVPYKLTYIADENGFQPQGAHLPTPPPLPEELRKALEQAGAHHQAGGQENFGHFEYQ